MTILLVIIWSQIRFLDLHLRIDRAPIWDFKLRLPLLNWMSIWFRRRSYLLVVPVSKKLVRQRSYWRRSGEYVQRRVCFVNIQSSLHENVVFSVCECMGNAAYIIFIMWNSISGLDACYHFRLNISCGVAVTVRSHQKKYQVTFLRGGRG